MTRSPLHAAPQQPGTSPVPLRPDDTAQRVVESEIVIVEDDGTEEPFDPALWFS